MDTFTIRINISAKNPEAKEELINQFKQMIANFSIEKTGSHLIVASVEEVE